MRNVLPILLFYVLGCSPAALFANHPDGIRAAVIVVIDQLGSEPFSTYKARAGFSRLTREALYVPNARYEVLHPETCPGHATIATGTLPWKHGIVGNTWKPAGERKELYCVDDADYRVSPHALARPGLSDILRELGYATRTVSVSGKDRAAVMLAGKNADQVVWYDPKSGDFISSKYYPEPGGVVARFNAEKNWMTFFNHPWEVSPSIRIPYGFALEPDREFFSAIYEGPALDQLTFDLFSQLVQQNAREFSDKFHVLGLSLSALDVVGHRHGSHSDHYRATLHSVDQILDRLLGLMDATYGRGHYLLAVTGDHGVFPVERKGNQSVSADQVSCARTGSKCAGVREKICYDSLDPSSRWYEAARHSFFQGRSEKCVQVYAENLIPHYGPGTSHLTPYPFDTDVPLWLIGNNLLPEVQGLVSPAAIVPTFLRQLGVSNLEHFDFDSAPLVFGR